ncbi:methionine adenosyltransferase [Halodesulfurarchaeum formicicum]|uniref:S-adenosylmethionine synthase n=1 Tax=Halodesulfurarchaeum formicicum TaxID=1873524 RepID=A0A1J1AB79_9EURY|nr:methionine adenosyltransferase [Halodesulfurarchaeum formicicum]APE95056.1 S-adenosylmethionine synthetase [Halodesulfurarchaeum formicicum]
MTDRNIRIQSLDRGAVEDQEIEIVERKGIGHPDSICDGIAEAVSRALAQAYLDRVGKVLHYNTDETQLVAGDAAPAFGGGEVVEPIYILIVGRATKRYEGQEIPVDSIALEAARNYLRENLPNLDLETDVIVDVRLGEGSGDLQEVFSEDGGTVPMANDTSFGVGHAPLSETEQIVYNTERRLIEDFGEDHPALGQDIKVMGKREGSTIDLTVAAALVDTFVPNMEAYEAEIDAIREYVTDLAYEYTDREVRVHVNTADDTAAGAIYLTTTGTSAEQGDDGSVGRGNRANGLITPNRSMSMEATSGKNPVNHIGKIYNLLSTKIAMEVVEEVEGIRDLRVRLLSQIGSPIDQPHVADLHVVTESGYELGDVDPEIRRIVDEGLASVEDVTAAVIRGELSTF